MPTDDSDHEVLRRHVAEMADEVRSLRAELAQLRSAIADDGSDNCSAVTNAPATAVSSQITRRHWMKGAAAAAVGGTVVALGQSSPAAAAIPMQIGGPPASDPGSSKFNHSEATGDPISFLFTNESPLTDEMVPSPAALGGWTGTQRRPSGVFGHSSVRSSTAYGVVGVNSSELGSGVRGVGRYGVSARGNEYGVVTRGALAGLFVQPTNTVAPSERDSIAEPGALDTQRTGDGGATASLWFCVGGPTDWRKLAGDDTAGSLHAIDPARVYDSRTPEPSGERLFLNGSRLVSVADGRDLETGAVVVDDVVPAGARAVAYNLTVVDTSLQGFLAVTPGDAATFSASSINWTGDEQIIANAGIVGLSSTRELKVFAGGVKSSSTHFIVDITGYYL